MKKVHLICNAHIDPIWQWDWQEGVSATLSTFRSAADLADEYDYIFCHNEVTLYKYVEEYAPELFCRIKELVKQGKWRIMGGWYLQPDCNMLSGESFVRQILKGKEYFTEKFGVFPTTAINFDPFGHTKGIVQIISKCGQDAYMFMRPYASEMKLPSEQFVWNGFASSSVKACRVEAYNTPLGKSAEIIRQRAERQPQDVVCVTWGVGNHGGGPSRKDLSDICELMKNGEIEYVHSDPDTFFSQMRAQAEYNDSLRISMPGCYTSMGKVKRAHIKLENELFQAEKMCAVASQKGLMEYPTEKFGEITEDLLNAEFHDTLPGSCVQNGETNALNLLGHGVLEAERLKTKAFFALSRQQEKASEGEYPILIFNSQPYDIEENVECEFILADQNWEDNIISVIRLSDENGNEVVCQQIKEESNINVDWRKRIIFKAKLKAMSMTRYSVYINFVPSEKKEIRQEFIFDDGRKYVEIDSKTGLLTHYRIDGIEYLGKGFGLVMCDDNADPWGMGAFQLNGIGENEQPFITEEIPDGPFKNLKSIQVIENGSIYLGIEAFFVKDNTRARILYKIYKNDDAVDIDVNLFMNDIDKIVKLKIPSAVKGEHIGQTAYGENKLFTDGRENVALRYVSVGSGGKSFAVINNCTYGSSYKEGSIYINLARGVTYCAHPISDRPIIPSDRYVKKIDQGENDFSFRIIASDTSQVGQLAQRFNQKPFAINAFPLSKDKENTSKDQPLLIDNAAITLEALKMADNGQGYIARLFNNTAENQTAYVKLFEKTVKVDFCGYEIKTLIYKNNSVTVSEDILI